MAKWRRKPRKKGSTNLQLPTPQEVYRSRHFAKLPGVVKVADTLSINNAMCFEASEKGSRRMAQKLSRSRSTFYGKICENLIDPMVNLQENFFKGED